MAGAAKPVAALRFPVVTVALGGDIPRFRLGFNIKKFGKRLQNSQNAGMVAAIISELRLAAHFDDARMMQAGQMLAQCRLRYSKLLGQAVYIFLMVGQMDTDLQSLGI